MTTRNIPRTPEMEEEVNRVLAMREGYVIGVTSTTLRLTGFVSDEDLRKIREEVKKRFPIRAKRRAAVVFKGQEYFVDTGDVLLTRGENLGVWFAYVGRVTREFAEFVAKLYLTPDEQYITDE